MSAVMDNILARHSTRVFTDQPVEQEKLEEIVKAAVWAPSGNNAQSWHFIMMSNVEKIQELAAAVRKATGSPATYNFYDPTAFLIISGERDNRNAALDASAALENALLAATDLGVGSCWINQVRDVCDDPEVRALLTSYGLPESHQVWTAASLGYAAKDPVVHERKPGTVSYVR